MEKSKDLAILILAAGTSSRLGKPKQLLKLNNKSLVQLTVEKALKLNPNVTVVLGDKSDLILKEIINYPISTIINPDYTKGIGNSLAFGILHIQKKEKKVLIMLCDQPLIPIKHYQTLIKKSNNNPNLIIASKYYSKLSVPVLFPKKYFKELVLLNGDKGAKKLFEEYPTDFILLEDSLAQDIDIEEDYKKILRRKNESSNY